MATEQQRSSTEAPADGEPASGQPKKPRGRPFTGADDPRLRQNLETAPPLEPSEDDQDMLAAMRWVQSHAKSQDRTELQKDCRQWKSKDLKGFMAKRADLERAEMAARGQNSTMAQSSAPVVDEPDATDDLIQRLLDECHAETAAEDARLAARPDAANIGASLQRSLNESLEREKMLQARIKKLEVSPVGRP
ncbi:MAG: hypothetical protein K2R98_16785 [Gemmataceae bacterium]|nr:hypothetical protein [Gemmataceae bacterium]